MHQKYTYLCRLRKNSLAYKVSALQAKIIMRNYFKFLIYRRSTAKMFQLGAKDFTLFRRKTNSFCHYNEMLSILEELVRKIDNVNFNIKNAEKIEEAAMRYLDEKPCKTWPLQINLWRGPGRINFLYIVASN